jgi:protein arginine kinase
MSGTGGFAGELFRGGAEWLSGRGGDSDVVISSRVRLARNLAGFPFVCRASRIQRQAVLDITQQRLTTTGIANHVLWVDVHRSAPLERLLMLERHLISKEHARSAPGDPTAQTACPSPAQKADEAAAEPRGVAISLPDESLSVMVNEEDHLRLQVVRPGLELSQAFAEVNRVDDLLEGESATGLGGKPIEFAFSPRFGYLTACPTNVGTGIRVSVMLHLPALKLVGEMDKVRRATRDMGLAVRGYYGEGSEAAGEFYQISNQTTLGKPEAVILQEFEREIIPQVIQYERASRRILLEKRRRMLEDKVFRSLGLLRAARLLTPEEAIVLLSDVRLGVLSGLIPEIELGTVNQLILLTQPAHLQRVIGRVLDQGERREARADFVRKAMGAA